MSFKDLLETPRAAEVVQHEQELPKPWRASREHRPDGSVALVTGPMPDTEAAVDEYLESHGFNRKHWMLQPGTGVLSKNWDSLLRVFHSELGESGGYVTEVKPMVSSRMVVVPRTVPVDMEELLAAVASQSPVTPLPRKSSLFFGRDDTFVAAWADLQAGKVESPLEQSIAKFKDCMEQARDDFIASGCGRVHIPALGDACEGIVSQGGKNMWRTTLTMTEQVRVLRRLYLWTIDLFLDAGALEVTAVTVASNHGQAQRQPVETRADDDWGIEAMVAVADAIEMNPDRYGNVKIYVPGPDEANVTLEVSGMTVAHAHGHLFYKGGNTVKSVFNWWRGHTFSGLPEGQADLLLTGHGHHLEISEESGRTWIMVPAAEEESVWWKHRTGQTGDPGILTFIISNGQWSGISRIRPRALSWHQREALAARDNK